MAGPMEIIPLASGLIDTAITVGSRIGGGFKIDEVAKNSYNNFAPHYVDSGMAKDATVQKWEVSAAWFTHTALSYAFARNVGPVATGQELMEGAESAVSATRAQNRENVQKSFLVASKFPYDITFDVVSYMPRDRRRQVAESITASHRGAAEYAKSLEDAIVRLKMKAEKTRSRRRKHDIEKDIENREKIFLEYTKALSDSTEDMLFEIAEKGVLRHNICNFRVSPARSAGSMKRGRSAGIFVEGFLSGGADWDGDVFIELKWQETILGKVYNWGGQLRVGLEADGTPSISGAGEFYKRFLATHTRLKMRERADSGIAINREARETAAAARRATEAAAPGEPSRTSSRGQKEGERQSRTGSQDGRPRSDKNRRADEAVAGPSDVRKHAIRDSDILRDPDRSAAHGKTTDTSRRRTDSPATPPRSDGDQQMDGSDLLQRLAMVWEEIDKANNSALHGTAQGESAPIWWLRDSEYIFIGENHLIFRQLRQGDVLPPGLERGEVIVLKHGLRGKIEVQLPLAAKRHVRHALRRATTKTVIWS